MTRKDIDVNRFLRKCHLVAKDIFFCMSKGATLLLQYHSRYRFLIVKLNNPPNFFFNLKIYSVCLCPFIVIWVNNFYNVWHESYSSLQNSTYSDTCLNRTLVKPKTCLNQTDFTITSTKCLCNLNLCKPNTCLNRTNSSVPRGFSLDRFHCICTRH